MDDWTRINRQVPRLVDALPNGPAGHPTVQVFLAGGVPEVMLHLRRAGLLETAALTVAGETLARVLDWWEQSERRADTAPRAAASATASIPTIVIMDPDSARAAAASPPRSPFPWATWRPEARSSRARPSTPAWWTRTASTARRGRRASSAREEARRGGHQETAASMPGDVMVLMCRGPMGSGMEEIYQITVGAEVPGIRQARRGDHRRALQRRFHRRLHRPRDAGSAGRRPASAKCAKATRSRS